MLPKNGGSIDVRRRQIDTLKIFNDNVTEIKVGEEYSVGFVTDGRQAVLKVFLGPKFPNEKPKIVVNPLMQHDWIPDPKTGLIQSAPGLLNFTVHSDLGRVVHAIIREFEKSSPPNWPSSGHPSMSQHAHTNTSPKSTQNPNNQHQPNIQSTIPELCNLTLDELHALNSDNEYLNDFVDDIDAVQRIQTDLDQLIGDVEGLAKENLAREQHLLQLRTNVETKLAEFRQHGDQYDALSQRYQKKSEEFAPQHIKELLQIAASTADSICDTHVEQFLRGEIDVQNFLDRYKEAKQLSAMRKAKEERLSHQLNELERHTY